MFCSDFKAARQTAPKAEISKVKGEIAANHDHIGKSNSLEICSLLFICNLLSAEAKSIDIPSLKRLFLEQKCRNWERRKDIFIYKCSLVENLVEATLL